MSAAILTAACCCGGFNGVVLTAYVEKWSRTRWARLRSNPTPPGEIGEDPPCEPPEFDFGPAACTSSYFLPDWTELDCPAGGTINIRLGTETFDECIDDVYAALIVELPFHHTDVVGLGTTLWYREPPGGGSPAVIGAGVATVAKDIFQAVVPLQWPGTYETPCVHREGDAEDIFMRATWAARALWATPPSAMDMLATGASWTIEVTATDLVLTKPGPVVESFALAGQDFGDVQTWLNARGVNTYSYTGASGALTATLAHPATMLQPFAAAAVPTSGTKLRLPMTSVDAQVVHDGTYDENAAPSWLVEQWNNSTGTGSPAVSAAVPLNLYAGTEFAFADGVKADYAALVSGDPWGSVDMAFDMGSAKYFPNYGTVYAGSQFIAPSAGPPYEWASSVSETTSAAWSGEFECLAHCVAFRQKMGWGNSLLWQLQRVG